MLQPTLFVEASAKNCITVIKPFYDVVRLLLRQRQQSVQQLQGRMSNGIGSNGSNGDREDHRDPSQNYRPRGCKKYVIL
jgi:hypothetical protein